MRTSMDRREFLGLAAAGAAGLVASVAACKLPGLSGGAPGESRLAARPHAPSQTLAPGLHAIDPDALRAINVYVPAGYRPEAPAPMLVLLHGAGRSASEWTGPQEVRDLMDEYGIVLLAPSSNGATWHSSGPDTQTIDDALAWTFDRVNVDSAYVGFGGFSDGASFGLSLGLANGDLFSQLFGFSAGYIEGLGQHGRPRIFMSHGTSDPILPYTNAQQIAAALQQSGYEVRFVSFPGGHTVEAATARQAFDWFVQGRAAQSSRARTRP